MIKIRESKRGFVLISSLVISTLIILSVGTYFYVAGSGLRIANITADNKRAYYLADAGLADAFMQLRGYSAPPSSFTVSNYNYTIGNGNGSYSVQVISNNATWPAFTITSTGTYGNMSKTLQLTVQQTSASMFAYLSNSEIHPSWGPLWWITNMYTVGPVHTNGQFNIWGNPIFDGAVSQAASAINYWPGVITDPSDFQHGLTLNAPAQAVFNNAILNNISAAASSPGGLLLSGDSSVTFNADGTINVTNSVKGWSNQNMAVPSNKAIYVNNGSVTVHGRVNGQATVGSDHNVYISDNIIYNTDPDPTHPNPSSTDIVALVAQNDIVVIAASAPTNVEIEAVMVAINGSFQVDNWWAPGKGNMLQYGSLINNICGPTGVFDPGSGTLYGGYNQLQYFDPKLKTIIPPCFPPSLDANGRISYSKINFKEL
jgi:Tfp pilus assembly protein PilX